MDQCGSPKVLLLGISYPDVKGHMDKHGYSEKLLVHKKLSVEQAVELVRRGILTEMDARDLARCVATEKVGGGLEAYTVSKEVGGVYRSDRHVYANFNNSRGLYNALTQNFGLIQFQQVILDYYWMPTGWLVTRWAKSLFQSTLPDLVRLKMLAFPGTRSRNRQRRNSDGENVDNNANNSDDQEESEDGDNSPSSPSKQTSLIELEEGVVFLPFCAHVCKELVGAIHILKKYYAITFVHKDELPGHALWKGTMEIDANVMQHRLGKRLDQEEIYCTFQPKDIYGSMEDSHINKDDVMKMLLSIDNFEHIRMIRLRPLRQHEPPSVFRDTVIEPEEGGFIGLNWEKGKQRFKEFRTRKKAPPPRQRKPRTVTSSEDSDTDDSEYVSSSDDDSTIGGEDEQGEEDRYCRETGAFIDVDFDPYDPGRIAETTNFYPCPTLDLISYTNGKEIVDDDYVMDSWAETWGPKASRKKNRKQDILQSQYQQLRRERKGFLSSHSRVPDSDAEEEEGYKWTLTDEDGWTLDLNGDAPEFELIPKIVKGAKVDHEMMASQYLFEMKNPGYKTLSRSYGYSSMMSCYQIPKSSVLSKIACAEEAQRIIQRKAEREQKKLEMSETESVAEDLSESESIIKDDVAPIDEMTLDDVDKLRSRHLRTYLKSYGQKKLPHGKDAKRVLLKDLVLKHMEKQRQEDRLGFLASIAISDEAAIGKESSALHNFADLALRTVPMPEEEKRVVKDSVGVADVLVEKDLPPFSPSFQHMYFDLRGTATFPNELYRLVQRAEAMVITHIISWQPKGKSFKVHDKEAFEKRILEPCCVDDDSTYGNFVQNLRNFGFVQIEEGSLKGGFRHEYFRRKRPEDVALISAVDNDSDDDVETRSVAASSESGESIRKESTRKESTSKVSVRKESIRKSSSKRKKQRTRATPKVEKEPRPSGPKKYNLSRSNDFPTELHRLLEDAEDQGIADVIGWTASGKAFAISNEDLFVKKILLRHSKKALISAFEAVLIQFGFRKTRKTGNDRRYLHPNFKKGHPEMASLIVAVGSRASSPPKKAAPSAVVVQDSKQRWNYTGHRGGRREAPTNQNNSVAAEIVSSPEELRIPKHWKGNVVDSLRHLLDSKDGPSTIKWLSDGAAFSIIAPEEFESRTLPEYFKSPSYPSFRRDLMALGFEPLGTSKELKGIMYHGLFHRDFPELWKLHNNPDLNEKAVYCLSLEQLQTTDTVENTACSIGNDDSWLELPPFKQLLFESIRSNYQLLSLSTATKKQRQLYNKLISDVHDIAQENTYTLAESVDDQMILKHLRVYFRSHFQWARKLLQGMKTVSESGEQKRTLRALIQKAESVNFDKADVSATDKEAEGMLKSTSHNVKLAGTEVEANYSVSLDTGANAVGSDLQNTEAPSRSRSKKRSAPSGGRKSGSSSGKKRKTSSSRRSTRARRSVVSPGSESMCVRSPETAVGMNTPGKQATGFLSNNSERSVMEGLPPPNVFDLLQSSTQGGQTSQEHQARPCNANTGNLRLFHLVESSSGNMSQAPSSPQNALEVSLQTCVVGRFPVSSLSMYLLDLLQPSLVEQVNGESSVREVLVKFGHPANSHSQLNVQPKFVLQSCDNRVALRHEVAEWFNGTYGSNKAEIDAIHQMVHFRQQESSLETLPEQVSRLEVYITLLRTTDGNAWLHDFCGVDLDSRIDHLFRKLMTCFLTDSFQHRLLRSDDLSAAEKMIWRDFYQHCVCLRDQVAIAANSPTSRLANIAVSPSSPLDNNRNATTNAAMLTNVNLLMLSSPNPLTNQASTPNRFPTLYG